MQYHSKAKLEGQIRVVLAEAEEAVKSEERGDVDGQPDEDDLKARTENVLKKMDAAGIAKGARRKAVDERVHAGCDRKPGWEQTKRFADKVATAADGEERQP